jgi:hypothetical protein
MSVIAKGVKLDSGKQWKESYNPNFLKLPERMTSGVELE